VCYCLMSTEVVQKVFCFILLFVTLHLGYACISTRVGMHLICGRLEEFALHERYQCISNSDGEVVIICMFIGKKHQIKNGAK